MSDRGSLGEPMLDRGSLGEPMLDRGAIGERSWIAERSTTLPGRLFYSRSRVNVRPFR
jgi:hypothetical protein